MADCFWTDLVGCAEDCGEAQPPSADPVLVLAGATHNADDLIPQVAGATTPMLGNLQFDSVDIYATPADDSGGCSTWVGNIATTDTALVGQTASIYPPDDPFSSTDYVWVLASAVAGTHKASGTNIPLANNGASGSSINMADLFAAIGYTDYSNSGFLLVATLRNTDTDEIWTATALANTCY